MANAETITNRGDADAHPGSAALDLPKGRCGGTHQPPPATTVVPGHQLRPGDVVVGGNGDLHRIDRLAAYPTRFSGVHGAGARIAYAADGSWRRTIADNHSYHRLAPPHD